MSANLHSASQIPDQHSPLSAALRVAAVVLVVLLAVVVHAAWHYVLTTAAVLAVVVVVVVATCLVAAVGRFAWLPHGSRRYLARALLARIGWHRLTRNLGLAKIDVHRNDKIRRRGSGRPKVRRLKARVRPDAHGLVLRVRTIPGVGRAEFEAAAPYLADHWRAARVSVSQRGPGRLLIRSLIRDPLTVPFTMDDHSAGLVDSARPYLGVDEWAADRHLHLRDTSGVLIGGLPGTGKTNLLSSLLHQWAGSAVAQPTILDGNGHLADWEAGTRGRYCGDSLDEAVGLLEDCHSEMRKRLRSALELTGSRNSWHRGPSAEWPLRPVVIDEFQVYLDAQSYKSDARSFALAQRCVSLVGQLVRRGRAAMFVAVLATQKATTDTAPSMITANCGISLCFAVKTMEAAAAVLGPDIRDYAVFSPTALQDPAYTGVLTSNMRTGADPYTRVRVPLISGQSPEGQGGITHGPRCGRPPWSQLPGSCGCSPSESPPLSMLPAFVKPAVLDGEPRPECAGLAGTLNRHIGSAEAPGSRPREARPA